VTTKVLNLYAGIGGNRKLWTDVDVTAVEWDEDKKLELADGWFKDNELPNPHEDLDLKLESKIIHAQIDKRRYRHSAVDNSTEYTIGFYGYVYEPT